MSTSALTLLPSLCKRGSQMLNSLARLPAVTRQPHPNHQAARGSPDMGHTHTCSSQPHEQRSPSTSADQSRPTANSVWWSQTFMCIGHWVGRPCSSERGCRLQAVALLLPARAHRPTLISASSGAAKSHSRTGGGALGCQVSSARAGGKPQEQRRVARQRAAAPRSCHVAVAKCAPARTCHVVAAGGYERLSMRREQHAAHCIAVPKQHCQLALWHAYVPDLRANEDEQDPRCCRVNMHARQQPGHALLP